MEYTEQQKAQFREEFAVRKRNQWLLAIPIIAAFALTVFFQDADTVFGLPMSVFGPAFLVVILCALGYSFHNWRCPACQKYLGRTMNPRFCPKCGVSLVA